jgi:hypothetical protein
VTRTYRLTFLRTRLFLNCLKSLQTCLTGLIIRPILLDFASVVVWIYKEAFALLFLNVPHHRRTFTRDLLLDSHKERIPTHNPFFYTHRVQSTTTHNTYTHIVPKSIRTFIMAAIISFIRTLLCCSRPNISDDTPPQAALPPLATVGQAPSSSLRPPPTMFTADEYIATLKKLPFSQFSSVQSKYDSLPPSRLVFAAEDYLKEIEDLQMYRFKSVQPKSKLCGRQTLSGTQRRR